MRRDIVPFVKDMRDHMLGFDSLFDDLVERGDTFYNTNIATYPKDNVLKLENTIIIEIALAGFSKDDIIITREGGHLDVAGEMQGREELDEGRYVYKNIASRSFTKRYTVAPEYKDVRARFKDGILSIHLEREPKAEDTKQIIEIS